MNEIDSSLVAEEVTNEDSPFQEHVTSSSPQVQRSSTRVTKAVNQEPPTFNYPSDVLLQLHAVEMEGNNLIRDTLRSSSSSTAAVATITTSVTTPALVWGEVGRGIVAATPDYDRGYLQLYHHFHFTI